ncbi:MAG: C-type lectin domain-containing protein [Methylovulum sp.]|nr:C-type lectin domain-containing protein [Methylovulum sp.]
MKKRQTMLLVNALTTALLASSATAVFADSAKVFNPDNSHYYQRFDIADINWNTAKGNCEALRGHLLTLPSESGVSSEENFVYTQLVSKSPAGSNANYFIGLFYTPSTFTWAWVTGETYPLFSAPPSVVNYNYIVMNSAALDTWYIRPVQFNGNSNSHTAGYICEWDGNHFVANATIPDLNANGVPEIASLYLDYKNNKHTVIIRDPQSHATISTLTFATSTTPPIGLAVIPGNGFFNDTKIAVLSNLNVQIKDAKDNSKVLKSIKFLNKTYQPRALSVMPDTDNNGFDELTVLGILKTGKATSETRDSSTGAKLFSDTF